MFRLRSCLLALTLAPALSASPPARAQVNGPPPARQNARTRLILKDGSYQIVTKYQIKGQTVVYTSAERAETEEIPTALIDWDATHKWEFDHSDEGHAAQQAADRAEREAATQQSPVLDPELAKEEAARASLTPTVAPDLRLPETGSAFALDTFRDTPELVPLMQVDGDLNPVNSHSTVKLLLNPLASPHPIVTLKGEGSNFQMHVNTPIFYLRIGDDPGSPGPATFTVDTLGSGKQKDDPSGGSDNSRYVILRTDIRTDARVLSSFTIAALGIKLQGDVIETRTKLLPGGHWMSITPRDPLDFGEYALVEVLDDRNVNKAVWDFGVHSNRGDNRDSIKPEPRRPSTLGRRPIQ